MEVFKKTLLKVILYLITNTSNKNLVRIMKLGEFLSIKEIKSHSKAVRKAFEENNPAIELTRNTLSNLSKNCKEKAIENFFINSEIFGRRKQKKLAKKLGFGLPWFFVISPTARCNLNCFGCYSGSYKKDDLSFGEIDRILTEAKELGIYFITISGGEPFLREDLLDLFAKHNDMYFQVYTNGTLINKDLAKKLERLGNVAPAISIEGFEKETEDRRGKGSFNKVIKAMENLKEAGVLFGFSATQTKNNLKSISSNKFIDLMISKGCAFGWYFQYVPIGKKPNTSLMPTPKQRLELKERIKDIRKTKPIFIGDFWNDGLVVRGCLAGARPRGYFHINCQGNVEPCVFLQFYVDNIKNKKLIDVIRSPFFKAIQEEQPYCKNKNLCTPCALIDNPQILRKLVKEYSAKASYEGGEDTIENKKITSFLDKYSKEIHNLTDSLWEKELCLKHKNWKEKRFI